MELILSLFPGVDLLGRGFASEGYSVVQGPDLITDGRIENFHVPAGRFDGIIGGPPCQEYSDANRLREPQRGDRLVLEFLRVVSEAQPRWFLIENVRMVPTVQIDGYSVQRLDITDAECGGPQKRLRHIQFGSQAGHIIRPVRNAFRKPTKPTLTCVIAEGQTHAERLRTQGVDFPLPLYSFTTAARARLIGNAVSLPVATTLAQAVTQRSVRTANDCPCQCGRTLTGKQRLATAACRKREQRKRDGDAPRFLVFP